MMVDKNLLTLNCRTRYKYRTPRHGILVTSLMGASLYRCGPNRDRSQRHKALASTVDVLRSSAPSLTPGIRAFIMQDRI